jgi:hypothetical protein
MKRAVGRGIACVLVLSAVTACGSDDSGGGAAGGTGGTTGGTGGATGGAGGATGGSGGTGAGGSGGATGGSAGAVPCTLTLTGAKTGTVDCTDNVSSEFIGVTTADTVSWAVGGDTADAKTNFSFHLAKPVTATTYVGTDADDQFCTASVTNSDFTGTWTVNSKSPAAGASCSITIESVAEDSSGTTSRFVVHGTATATLVKGTDPATVQMDVTF